MEERTSSHVAYRAVLLAAALFLFGYLFRELVTLFLAVLTTVILAIPLAAAATRLERRGVPRAIGALLGLFGAFAVLAVIVLLLIPPFVDQTNQFVDDVPGIVDDLEKRLSDISGADQSEVGDRVQDFVERYTEDPERLIGPITSIGLSVAGIAAALVLMVITAYYMAVRPDPLIDGLVSLVPPRRRPHMRHFLDRLRGAWVGWMQGIALDMVVSFVLLYIGLTLVGLDFAVFFAVLSALLVVVPYFGAIAGAIPPTLFALTDSPGKALVVMLVYVLSQQIEGNLTIPLVMSRTVRLHPAVIAIGVIVVGQLFGLLGLFVAVPILSLLVIGTEEFWVRQLEEGERDRRIGELELPSTAKPEAELPEAARAMEGEPQPPLRAS